MTLVVSVIPLGKGIEVMCLLFEARGLETDQRDVLMFKFDSILTRQRAAGGWRKQHPLREIGHRLHFQSFRYTVRLLILSDILVFSAVNTADKNHNYIIRSAQISSSGVNKANA